MKLIYSPKYEADIGTHVFVTAKYRLALEKLLRDGSILQGDVVAPTPATREELTRVHTAEYLDDLLNYRMTARTRRSELPLTEEILEAYLLAAGGSIQACRTAVTSAEQTCAHLGGGWHHAFADHAEGFCYLNDIAIGIRAMQAEQRIRRAVVIDCDLHQGNGTAHIFGGDADVFTFSIHQENNYPAKQRSNWDIGLDDFTGDDEYLAALQEAVPDIYEQHKPELVFYVAGADPYFNDQLGALRLTMHGLEQRDEVVIGEAAKRNIPLVTTTAGGYARHVQETVDIHVQTVQVAAKYARA
ncbi:MAG: histone deacetylase family protein [Candidatus Sumerlaeaceae bacterium]